MKVLVLYKYFSRRSVLLGSQYHCGILLRCLQLVLVPSFANLDLCNIIRYEDLVQYTLDLRKPDLRKNLDLRKIAGATDFLVHKLFDLRKIFKGLMFDLRKISFQKVEKIGTFW